MKAIDKIISFTFCKLSEKMYGFANMDLKLAKNANKNQNICLPTKSIWILSNNAEFYADSKCVEMGSKKTSGRKS